MSFEELREVSHKEEFCVWDKHVFAQILKHDFNKSELKAAQWIRTESENNIYPSTYHINVLIACYVALKKKESKANTGAFCNGATLGSVGFLTEENDISVEDVASELSLGMETLGSIAETGGSFSDYVDLASSVVSDGSAVSLAMEDAEGLVGFGKALGNGLSSNKTMKQLKKALDGPGLKGTLYEKTVLVARCTFIITAKICVISLLY